MAATTARARRSDSSGDLSIPMIFLGLALFMGVVISLSYPPARTAGMNLFDGIDGSFFSGAQVVRVNELPHV